MSPEEHDEAAGETIEDLEAPAAAQTDVAGGAGPGCMRPTCREASNVKTFCDGPTCSDTATLCTSDSEYVVMHIA